MNALFELQQWFANHITQPFQPDQCLRMDDKREIERIIAPSQTMRPLKRLELYHRQYWWRLLDSLQQNFPQFTDFKGHEVFNRDIAIPYLLKNPPNHWALCKLGQSLPTWLKQEGFSKIDCTIAEIEAASQRTFWVKEEKTIDFASLNQTEIASKKLMLQQHIHLFSIDFDFFSLPKINKKQSLLALYRSPKNQVKWKELNKLEFLLLTFFKNGGSIQEACALVEKEACEMLPLWFREWTFLKWFREP